jgi:ADP-ribosylglycohydrolase/catechol 2,3-dioxygenase-like lactoylglutathione lyase family enzyme
MDPVMLAGSPAPDHDATERAEGAFLGAAVGDALGWPVEDRSGRVGGRRDLEPSFEFIAWRRREGGRYQPHEEEIQSGSYSDDTQLTLAVARARLAGSEWWSLFTRYELPFWLLYERGGGGATKRAAKSWSRATPPWLDKEARRYFDAGGNGVAMRIAAHCLVPGAATFGEVASAVIADGISTHGHPRALVGAVLQAYAIRRSLDQRGILGYGALIEDVLGSEDWREFRKPEEVASEWEELADNHFSRPYRDIWNEIVEETEQMLEIARTGISRGSLAVDRPVLEQIGAFGPSSGAGTVTAVGGVFLASRHAAQPASGVTAAAFAKGADTDTLAAMTGAILGAIHGTDWLASAARQVEDAGYIRALAQRLLRTTDAPDVELEAVPLPTTRSFWKKFGEPQTGQSVGLPGGRAGKVIAVTRHDTKRLDLLPVTWVVETEEGQTLHFKRVRKIAKADQAVLGSTDQERSAASDLDRRPRIGVVLHVSDLRRARWFYEHVVGLEISKEARERTVFAGLLALEPLPRSLQAEREDEQLALAGVEAKPSFDTSCAVTIYVQTLQFEDIYNRIEKASLPISDVTVQQGRPMFRCLDPDQNVVEFRCRNGV